VKLVDFDAAESYEPDAGWRRVEMAGSEAVSLEWFEKPPGHSSPMHSHENEQVCVVLGGELVLESEADRYELGENDSVLLESNEPHRATNPGDTVAVGIDVFAPGRSFDYWTDRDD
jgi:quercetin dioxygenase-like cupin family protein